MSDLVPYPGGALSRRQHNKELARIRQEADSRATRISAKTFVTMVAQNDAALVAMNEEALAQKAPLATSRLAMIGDAHTVSILDEVMRPWSS